jgi:inhibitor of KinA sporulation pathway (predicted exonuclease)
MSNLQKCKIYKKMSNLQKCKIYKKFQIYKNVKKYKKFTKIWKNSVFPGQALW